MIYSITILFFLLSVASSQNNVSTYEKLLKKISKQVEEVEAKIEREEKRKNSILSRLATLTLQKKLIQNQISYLQVKLTKTNKELSSLQKKIHQLNFQLEKRKESIQKILVTLYKFGQPNFFQYMLQVENVNTLWKESKRLSFLARYQENIISDYLQKLNELKDNLRKQETMKNQISQILNQAEQKRKNLQDKERENRVLIQKIEKNKSTYLKTLQELKERAHQLQNLIKKILNDKVSPAFNLTPLYERKGELPWPLPGKIVTHFGLQHHPRFNTVTVNKGIEISPLPDKLTIKSIHPGVVAYADYFQGYGNLIIIDHGLSYYSLYAHCSQFLVKKGDAVETGQPIALVGDIGSVKGTTLYFELRFKTKPLNPLQWLKRR